AERRPAIRRSGVEGHVDADLLSQRCAGAGLDAVRGAGRADQAAAEEVTGERRCFSLVRRGAVAEDGPTNIFGGIPWPPSCAYCSQSWGWWPGSQRLQRKVIRTGRCESWSGSRPADR